MLRLIGRAGAGFRFTLVTRRRILRQARSRRSLADTATRQGFRAPGRPFLRDYDGFRCCSLQTTDSDGDDVFSVTTPLYYVSAGV